MLKWKLGTLALAAMLWLGQTTSYAANVSIDIKYPGGNVLVGEKQGNVINVKPDLRGGSDWFYWNFDATSDAPGEVKFVFGAAKVGPQGPAHSLDGGKTWKWLGSTSNAGTEFSYTFDKAGQTVRFAVAIPYQFAKLQEFLDSQKGNALLKQSVLTKSRHGRDVPLLQIGEPGEGKEAVIMTARHHACESMVSYALEGLMTELLSDSYTAREFLKKHVVYVIPMVDVDGVEEGDQGKNRPPYDHNRDYRPGENIYPEITAIMKLADDKQIHYAMDFHCPALRGYVHYSFYYDGPRFPHTDVIINQMRAWQNEEGPMVLPDTLNFMKAITPNRTPMNSDFFGYRKDVVMAATIEVPYSIPGVRLTEDMVRAYGVSMLKAWRHTAFVKDADEDMGLKSIASLYSYRNRLRGLVNSPEAFEKLVEEHLNTPGVPDLYEVETHIHRASMARVQKNFALAAKEGTLAAEHPAATTSQRQVAIEGLLETVLEDPATDLAKAGAHITSTLSTPDLQSQVRYNIYIAAADFYDQKQQYEDALKYTRMQQSASPRQGRGRILIRIASVLDKLGKTEEALENRQQAVRYLRSQLNPIPAGGNGPPLAKDLLEALDGIPTTTKAEKIAVVKMIIEHRITTDTTRASMQERLKELEKE